MLSELHDIYSANVTNSNEFYISVFLNLDYAESIIKTNL